MKTEEGNRLIHDFMGNDMFPDKKHYHGMLTVSDLKYHSSWDWLMPVVEKISGIAESAYYTEANENELYAKCGEVMSTHVCVSIETLWKRVVEFITWYNKTKSQ